MIIMDYNDPNRQKAEIRAQLKQIRASIPKNERLSYSQSITQKVLTLNEVISAQYIFIYISYASEVDTHELINRLIAQGKKLAVPKIIDSDHMLSVPFLSWDKLETGQLNILTPMNSEPLDVDFDVVITPGLGFTTQGHRIGYGRGYYDKWFAKHTTLYKLGLAFEKQILNELPINEFDVPLDRIVTENKIITI